MSAAPVTRRVELVSVKQAPRRRHSRPGKGFCQHPKARPPYGRMCLPCKARYMREWRKKYLQEFRGWRENQRQGASA